MPVTARRQGIGNPGGLVAVEDHAGSRGLFAGLGRVPAVHEQNRLSGAHEERQAQLADLLAGYEDFAAFERRELALIEALRTLRLIHYSAWIARRWDDPAFPAAFPWFDTPRYWEQKILELREQIAAMAEPPLAA